MPELPEVEVFRRHFEATSLYQTIRRAEVLNEDILRGISPRKLQNRVENHEFDSSLRHGKYLFAHLSDDGWLVFHFGMTGYLKYFKLEDKAPEHTRLLFHFNDDHHLAYISQRKLGHISLVESPDDFVNRQQRGPDVLDDDFDMDSLNMVLSKARSSVKSALMNQRLLAGIGNIYSDEILFQAGIHPRAKANQLDEDGIRRLYDAMKEVLRTAIESKADFAQMPETYLLAHRQKGGECPVCGGYLRREKVCGRTAYYCPRCQS